MRPAFVCAVATVAAVVTALAEDFPLTFKSIPAADAMAFPGGGGGRGLLRTAKPHRLKQEPKAVSHHPLYGEYGDGSEGGAFLFRLDESSGDGTGYDRLIVDMNQNGDLTDDAVSKSVRMPDERGRTQVNQSFFGPIQAPPGQTIAGGRPVYFAEARFFGLPVTASGRLPQRPDVGQLIVTPGWYLETRVKVDGLEQRVGVLDANCNLRLGDVPQQVIFTNRGQTTWAFRSGDRFLLSTNGSGTFRNDAFGEASYPFGPILYLASKACKVGLSADDRALQVEPWPEPLAEVALQPRGELVHHLTLVRQRPDGHWQTLRPAVTGGKVLVPPGDYRLFESTLLGKGAVGDQVRLDGWQWTPQTPVRFAAGKANTLNCGAPLQVKVTANAVSGPAPGIWERYFRGTAADSGTALNLNATVSGAGGEEYVNIFAGEDYKRRPPKPTLTIVEAGGKTVASGNLEYG
jgi:hypothetical protein